MDEKDAKIKRLEWLIKEKDSEINETRRVVWNLLHILENRRDNKDYTVKEYTDEAWALFMER